MTPPERALDVERLLAQSDWARHLARRLVGDAGLADDLVQDAWVAALERPPEGKRLREWLAAVVRNLALRRRRREAVRGDFERLAERRAPPQGADQALERLELQRLLAERVLALEEPCRSAVVLRHVEGLSTREIAARQGCSEDAARQRIARGLAKLRERLDARALGAFAVAWGGTRDAAIAGAGVIGGTLVGTKTVVTVAVCAVLGGALWFARDAALAPRTAAPTALRAVVPAQPSEATERAPEAALVAGSTGQRDAVALPIEVTAAPALRGRCRDDRGLSLEGVVVQLLDEHSHESLSSTESDAAGDFSLALEGLAAPADGTWHIQAHLAGHVPADLEHAGPELGELVLARRPLVTGTVLRPDGAPAAPPGRAELSLLDALGTQAWTHVEIDAEGRFRADTLAPGRLVQARCLARGFAPGELRPDLDLAPGSQHELVLTLATGDVLRGVVLDADSGEPVPHAEVWSESWGYNANSIEPSTVADAGGRFELHGVHCTTVTNDQGPTSVAWVLVTARAQGYLGRLFEPTILHRNEDGELSQVTIRISRADAAVAGRATWPDGSAAPGVPIYAVDDGTNLKFTQSDDEGRFELEGLAPGPLAICARTRPESPDGHVGRADASVELVAGARATCDLVLALPSERIAGRVLDERGVGLPGVELEAGEHFYTGRLTLGMGSHRATTDADGRYTFSNLSPGRYQVEVVASERRERAARPAHHSIDLIAGEPREDADFELVPAVVCAGWVDVGGADPQAFEVARVRSADGAELERRKLDADGRFSFEGCWPEACALILFDQGRELARIEVGPTGGQGLVLVAPR